MREDANAEREHLLARADIAIYEVNVATDKLLSLESHALEKFASLPEFDAAVRNVGLARLIYRFDQAVDLTDAAQLEMNADAPIATSVQGGNTGKSQRVITRSNMGAHLQLVAVRSAASSAGPQIHGTLGLSGVSESGTDDDTRTIYRKTSQSIDAAMKWGEPLVTISLDNAATDGETPAVAYVTRIVLRDAAARN